MGKPVISTRIDKQIDKMIASAADKRGITKSEMLTKLIQDNITDYKELTELERQYAEQQKLQTEEEMEAFLAQRKMKAATFITYLRSQVKKLLNNGANKDEVVDILESYRGVAERRDKLSELERYIQDFKDGKDNDVVPGEYRT